jgi:hypothetical protein
MFGDKMKRKRRALANHLERECLPESPYHGRGPRYLVHPEIALACAPSLRALAAALRDDAIAFDESDLGAIKTFACDGPSAFYGRDATAAKREAVRLQHAVLDPRPGGRGRTHVKQPNAQVRHPSPALTSSARSAIIISTGTLAFGAFLVAAVIIAPAALGASSKSEQRQHATRAGSSGSLPATHQPAIASSPCPCNVGLPGGPSSVGLAGGVRTVVTKRAGSGLIASHKTATSASPCPCNVGLPGGPSAAGLSRGVPRFVIRTGSSDLGTVNAATAAAAASSPCPCNVGLPGGPSAVGLAGGVPANVVKR